MICLSYLIYLVSAGTNRCPSPSQLYPQIFAVHDDIVADAEMSSHLHCPDSCKCDWATASYTLPEAWLSKVMGKID